MQKLIVNLGKHSYPIHIGGFLNKEIDFSSILKELNVNYDKILIVTNSKVAPLYLKQVKEIVTDTIPASSNLYEYLMLPDGELHKNFESLNQILSLMLELKFSRKSLLIALGGGVIGDIVGFAASIYQRGIDFIQIPTTLLSQVDSSVGGKTAINHPLGKNMIGSFKQPKCVFIDPLFLTTLSNNDFSSGLAEVIKYGLIRDIKYFDWLEKNMPAILNKDSNILEEMIQRAVQNKIDVVEIDEFETGERMLLNLGHTFGHAIETLQKYCGLSHGQAVSVGTMLAMTVSKELGNISILDCEKVKNLLIQAQLPVTIPDGIKLDDMINAMKLDKKNSDNTIRLILIQSIGSAYSTNDVSLEMIKNAIRQFGVNQ